jgi:hypothetical protein
MSKRRAAGLLYRLEDTGLAQAEGMEMRQTIKIKSAKASPFGRLRRRSARDRSGRRVVAQAKVVNPEAGTLSWVGVNANCAAAGPAIVGRIKAAVSKSDSDVSADKNAGVGAFDGGEARPIGSFAPRLRPRRSACRQIIGLRSRAKNKKSGAGAR